jgi:hypothetical protein
VAKKVCKTHTLTLVNVPHGAQYGPEAIDGLGHPHEEGVHQRGNPFKQLACIFDPENADRDFISQFR